MGKINNVLNHYFRDKQHFADLFNGVCFHGRTVIKVDSLTDGSEVYYEPLAEKGVLLSTGKSKKAQAGQRLERVRVRLKSYVNLRYLTESVRYTRYACITVKNRGMVQGACVT